MTKNFKGGYKIVSLNNNDLASGDSFVVNGLYENLVNSYKKPILVTEIVIDGEKQQDSFAVVKQSDGGYKIDVYDYALTVTSEDSVSAVALPEITSIGDGLTLEDGELSATGGNTLYVHSIRMTSSSSPTLYCMFTHISSSDVTINTATKLKNIINDDKNRVASGMIYSSTQTVIISGFYYNNSASTLNILGAKTSDGQGAITGVSFSLGTLTIDDYVIEIQ